MLNAQTGMRARTGLRRALKFAGQALFMMAAARATIAGGASPFAIACFTAGLYAGLDFKPLLTGCIMGCPWENMTPRGAATVLGCAAAVAIWAVTERIARGENPLSSLIARAPDALKASAAAIIPGAIAGFAGCSDIGPAVACPLIAQALAPVMLASGAVNFSRTALLGEERLSVCILAAVALYGVANSPASFLAGPLAAFIILIASYAGAAEGAAAGAVAGACLALVTGSAGLTASLCAAGLAAGLTLPLGRGWSALSFTLINLIGVMYSDYIEITALSPVACLAAGIAYCLAGEDAAERLAGWMSPRASTPDAGHMANRLRLSSKERLSALEKAFETLADGYGDFPSGMDERSMTARLRQALCTGCPGYEACWGGNGDRAGRLLCSLLASALKGDVLRETDEVTPEQARGCRRAAIIPRKLSPVLSEFYEDKKRAAQSRTNAATLARHFKSAKNILSRAVRGLDDTLYVDNGLCQTAEAALEREGFDDARAIVMAGERVEVAATRDEMWLEDEARQAQSALSKALAVPLRAAFSRGGDATLRLVQAPRLSARVGCACRPLSNQAPCGDSYVATALNAGRVLVALSDGMGSGARAAGESARTVELIRRFLQAGIDDALTLDSINQLLLLRGDDEMFATADICVIDLNEAKARFVKQGACASYIVRGKSVEVIEGGRLPLGILDEVRPGAREASLSHGDVIVMLTDGVCDGAEDGDAEWLNGTLANLARKSSDEICRELISSALVRREANPDDMTAIAISITGAGV